MKLIKDECYWCESPVTRPSVNLPWIDDYESADCEFHPYAFDSSTLKRTGETAPHQTISEVHEIISEYSRIKKLQRDKTQRIRAVDDNAVVTSLKSQRTSSKAASNVLPRTGSIRRQIFDLIQNHGGLSDDALENIMQGKHQTISASRHSLVRDGWLIDSGRTAKNASGNDCIVWVAVSFNNGMLFGNV